jgi:pimeloyl-ACP methyl ester carboxylesterase
VTLAVPHPGAMMPTPRMIWLVRHFFTLRRKGAGARLRRDDFAYVDELVARWSPAWQVPADETARVKESFAHSGVAEAAAAYYRTVGPKLQKAFRDPITVPSVAFAGTDDMIALRAYHKARRCYAGPHEAVEMPGGHFMHREHPDVFTRKLVRVLQA